LEYFFIARLFSINASITESSTDKYFFSHTNCFLFKYCYDFAKEKITNIFDSELYLYLMQIKSKVMKLEG